MGGNAIRLPSNPTFTTQGSLGAETAKNKKGKDLYPYDDPFEPNMLEVDPTFLTKLQTVLKDETATWFSKEQAQALQQIVHGNNCHTVTVLRTGGGKTLLYVIPALFIRDHGVYVVIVPNRALLEDLKQRLIGYNLQMAEWKSNEDVKRLDKPVILISADIFPKQWVLNALHTLKNSGVLKGFMVDEAHKWISETHYRYYLQDPSMVAKFGVPVHLLTATLRPGQEGKLAQVFGMPEGSFRLIRGSIDRPNLVYEVIKVPPSSSPQGKVVMDRVVSEVKRLTKKMKPGELGLIISRSRETADDLAKKLGCYSFHRKVADNMEQTVTRNYLEWQNLKNLKEVSPTLEHWLSCTPLIDTGNDTQAVSYTIFCEPPYDMISFMQGGGRTAREGQTGVVKVFYDSYQEAFLSEGADREFQDVEGVKQFVENETECRRLMLTKTWDVKGVSCGGVPFAQLCDICEKKQAGMIAARKDSRGPDVVAAVARQHALMTKMLEEELNRLHLMQKHLVSRGTCPFHLIIKGEVKVHKLEDCDLKRTRGEATPIQIGFKGFKDTVRWVPGFVCFHCFFPQGAKEPRFHNGRDWNSCKRKALEPGKKTFAEESKPFVAALLWAIFCDDNLAKRVKDIHPFQHVEGLEAAFREQIAGVFMMSHVTVGHQWISHLLPKDLEEMELE